MSVRLYQMAEFSFKGPDKGNPFKEVTLSAVARNEDSGQAFTVPGFYDGNGVYKVRLLPTAEGRWTVTLNSNAPELDQQTGSVLCRGTAENLHGPVRAVDEWHFAYMDGTPYYENGTTCYAWTHQPKELRRKTLRTLKYSPFNKIRFCAFPKHYRYNENVPETFVFEGTEADGFDFSRFNPAFFKTFEGCIEALQKLGIEADIILFHPYDRWGFSKMPREVDDFYLRYMVARLWAYGNIWWSFANEFDFMKEKTAEDFDHYGTLVQQIDPANHLRSIHNARIFFDHTKPWVTHCSIQRYDMQRIPEWHEQYHKPIVMDEIRYEGNIPNTWGNLTGLQLVDYYWEGLCYGGFCGHGETYLNTREELWWSKGGELVGSAPKRLKFYNKILSEMPNDFVPGRLGISRPCISSPQGVHLYYMGNTQSAAADFTMPDNGTYEADIIDVWRMKITTLKETFKGPEFSILLPEEPYLAIRLRRVQE